MKCKLFKVIVFMLLLVFIIIYSHSFTEETCAEPGPLMVINFCVCLCFWIFVFASVFIFVFVLVFWLYVHSQKRKRLQGQACSWSYAPTVYQGPLEGLQIRGTRKWFSSQLLNQPVNQQMCARHLVHGRSWLQYKLFWKDLGSMATYRVSEKNWLLEQNPNQNWVLWN